MMNNQLYVNSAELIREIYDDYNIASDDFVSRAPAWIYNALDELNFVQAYVEKSTSLNVEEYRCKLPDDFKGLIDIIIEDKKIPLRSPHDNTFESKFKDIETKDESNHNTTDKSFESISHNKHNVEYYISNNWIHTNIENATIYLKYKAIPSELDDNLQMYFPLIYNEGLLRRYIKLYIIRQILLRGYKHPVLNLTSNNYVINPALELVNIKQAVRVACNKFNRDRRENIARILTNCKI